jgi:SAM-dependent methyltransferase
MERPDAGVPAVKWREQGVARRAPWRRHDPWPAPERAVVVAEDLRADEALRMAAGGCGLMWRGRYHGVRLLSDAMKRRLARRSFPAGGDPAAMFQQYRQARSHRARLLGMVLLELDAHDVVCAARAPDVREACREAFGPPAGRSVITLPDLLGALGAWQWRERGVPIPQLNGCIHPYYGVFSPTRADYVDLVAHAPLPTTERAFDIGTGTGVLAAVLARRGVRRIVATDINPDAVACARDNAARLRLADRIDVRHTDLFPPGRAGLIVCNPPWLPGRPTSPLEAGVFDRGGRMLARVVQQLPDHLARHGEAWILLSDLAELLGLRTRTALLDRFDHAGLVVLDRLETPPTTAIRSRGDDPLRVFRERETVSLWRLRRR